LKRYFQNPLHAIDRSDVFNPYGSGPVPEAVTSIDAGSNELLNTSRRLLLKAEISRRTAESVCGYADLFGSGTAKILPCGTRLGMKVANERDRHLIGQQFSELFEEDISVFER
jgi:hypothetical protein